MHAAPVAAKIQNLVTFDAAYLEALARGDEEVERQFVAYFTPLVHAKLRKFFRSQEMVEDAAQETFARVVSAVRARGGVRSPERFGAFVQAVCGHVAMEHWRRERRFAPMDDVQHEPATTQRSPLSLVEAGETRAMVQRVLAELPEQDRLLLEALFLDEEDRDVLCARFNVTEGYLRVLLCRAKKRFIEEMQALTTKAEHGAGAAVVQNAGLPQQAKRFLVSPIKSAEETGVRRTCVRPRSPASFASSAVNRRFAAR